MCAAADVGAQPTGALLRAGGHAPDLSRWRAAIARAASGKDFKLSNDGPQ